MDRDLEIHRLTARLRTLRRFGLDLCLGHMVGRGRPRARVRRTARPHRQRGSPAAARLALPGGRAVLRGDPRQPDGPGEPPPVPLDPRPDQRLLGRGVHRRTGSTGTRRARRPVRLHRQPGQQPVAPDAGRARHHPGRPGRDHPRGLPRRARRRRRPGHGQDRRRAAPHGVPPVLRPAPRPPPGRRAVRRPAPALPRLRRRRAAQPRRGGRADLHPARPRPRGRRRAGRDRPGGGPAEVVRGHGAGRSSRPSGSTRSRPPRAWRSRPRGPTSGSAPTTGPRRSTRRTPAPRTTRRATRSGRSCSRSWWTSTRTTRTTMPRATCCAGRSRRTTELVDAFNRAWPLLEPTDLVGDLWEVPAYLRHVRALARARRGPSCCSARTPQAWTVSDLPLLDAARQRLGDPEASRRRRRHEAAVAAERERMDRRRRRPARARRRRTA